MVTDRTSLGYGEEAGEIRHRKGHLEYLAGRQKEGRGDRAATERHMQQESLRSRFWLKAWT